MPMGLRLVSGITSCGWDYGLRVGVRFSNPLKQLFDIHIFPIYASHAERLETAWMHSLGILLQSWLILSRFPVYCHFLCFIKTASATWSWQDFHQKSDNFLWVVLDLQTYLRFIATTYAIYIQVNKSTHNILLKNSYLTRKIFFRLEWVPTFHWLDTIVFAS